MSPLIYELYSRKLHTHTRSILYIKDRTPTSLIWILYMSVIWIHVCPRVSIVHSLGFFLFRDSMHILVGRAFSFSIDDKFNGCICIKAEFLFLRRHFAFCDKKRKPFTVFVDIFRPDMQWRIFGSERSKSVRFLKESHRIHVYRHYYEFVLMFARS